MTLLTLGYSSLASRVGNIQPPQLEVDSELLLITQGGGFKAPKGFRSVELDSIGVAKSRNEAIRQAKGKYLVFADDDIVFLDGLADAIRTMETNPQITLLLGKAVSEGGIERKKYPTKARRLGLLNSARAATYEIVVRVDDLRSRGIWFDENFGAGVENYLGDEYIFIADLIRDGAECWYYPFVLAAHPEDSSGARWGTSADRIARAKVFDRVFGNLAWAVRMAFGSRHLARLGLLGYLRFVFGR